MKKHGLSSALILAGVCLTTVLVVWTVLGSKQRTSPEPNTNSVPANSKGLETSATKDVATSRSDSEQLTEPKDVGNEISSPTSVPPVVRRATLAEAKALCVQARQLEKSSRAIAFNPACESDKDSMDHITLLRDEVSPWRQREEEWKEKFIAVNGRCAGNDMLGLKLTLAMSSLALVETWFWDAADAEAFSNPAHAKVYLRGVNGALTRAEDILSGKLKIDHEDPEKAVFAIPAYIERIEQN